MGTKIKNQSGFSVIEALLLLVIIGMLGFTGWYVWHAKQAADKTLSSDGSSTPNLNKKTTDSKSASLPLTPGPGAEWNTYTNKQLGFSIQVPKNIYSNVGAPCTKKTNPDSYYANAGAVAAGIFQNDNNYYIAEDYTFQPTGAKDNDSGITTFSGCKKVMTTGALIAKSEKDHLTTGSYVYTPLWFNVTTVSNEQGVKNWVDNEFGNSVWIASKTANNGGWQDINLECDHAHATCLNYGFQLRYYSSKKLLVYMVQGQSMKLETLDQKGAYDRQVFASFKVL